MTPKLHESTGRVQFGVLEKLTSAWYFKIAREIMLSKYNSVETPGKFIIAKLSIRKLKSSYQC